MKQLLALLIAVSTAFGVQQVGRAIGVIAPPPLNIPSDRTFQTNHGGSITALAFMRDGRLLSTGTDRTFRIWDAKTGIQEAVLGTALAADESIAAMAFDRMGKYLVIANSGSVQLLEFETRRRLWSVDPQMQDVQSAAFSSDGRSVAVTSIEGDIDLRQVTKQFDVATGRLSRVRTDTVKDDAERNISAVSDDKAMTASVVDNDTIVLKDSAGRTLHVLTRQRGLAAVAFSPDGKFLASGSNGNGDGAVKIWDVAAGREFKILDDERQGVLSLAFSGDGLFLAAAGSGLRIIDVQRGVRTRQLVPEQDSVFSLSVTRDGRRLASAGRNLTIWDFATGASLFTVAKQFTQVAVSSDGRLLAAADFYAPLTIYNVATGQIVRTIPLPGGVPSALEFTPDGSRVLLGTRTPPTVATDPITRRPSISPPIPNRAAVFAWEVNTGQQSYSIPAKDWVTKIGFTSDGRLIAVFGEADQAGTVKLYDAQTGRELRTLVERVDASKAATFSPDRMWIAGGPFDLSGAVQLWRLML